MFPLRPLVASVLVLAALLPGASKSAVALDLLPSWRTVKGDDPDALRAAGWSLNPAAHRSGAFAMTGRGSFRLQDDDAGAAPSAALPFAPLPEGTLSLRLGVAGLRNQNAMLRLKSGGTVLLEVFLLNNEEGHIKTAAGLRAFKGIGWLNTPRDLFISWRGAAAGKTGTVTVAFDAGTPEGRAAAQVVDAPLLAAGIPDSLQFEAGFASAVNRTLLADKLRLAASAAAMPDFSGPRPNPTVQDFETEASLAGWRAVGSTLARTTDRYISGSHSLRWSWTAPGAQLLFENEDAFAGQGEKSALGLWVYNAEPTPDLLRAELLDAGQVVGSFWYRLNYRGWRPLGAPYAVVAPGKSFDAIRFQAPPGRRQGSLDIDYFNTSSSGPLRADYQQPWVDDASLLQAPAKTIYSASNWQQGRKAAPALPATVTTEQRAELAALRARLLPPVKQPRTGLAAAALEPLRAKVRQWRIERKNGIVSGLPIVQASFNAPSENVPLADYMKLVGEVVRAYGLAKEPGQIEELRALFLLLTDHWLECGWQEGNNAFGWLGTGYDLRDWPPYFFAMRDELKQAGRLEAVMQAVAWSLGGGRELLEAKPKEISIDILLNYNRALAPAFLALADECQQVQRLQALTNYLNYFFVDSGLLGPDGTVYHHWMHNILYGSYAVPFPVDTYVDALMKTRSFRLSPAAHERLRLYAYANAFSALGGEFAPNMNPRAGTPYRWNPATTVKTLASWGPVDPNGARDGNTAIDPRMAALYLALSPGATDDAAVQFRASGILPLPLEGHLSLNGGVAAIQRRKEFLTVAVGMNKNWRGLEIYGWLWTNNYGRYARNGSLFVQTPEDPAGGYRPEGWNWSLWPGATSWLRPSAELFDYYRIYNNQSTLAGGTTLGADGIWGMDFAGPDMKFRKSMFFFDNRITVVTSGIEGKENRPAVTTLYQQALPATATPTQLDGAATTGFPTDTRPAADAPHWLMDSRGNGYFIPPAQARLRVLRRSQDWVYMTPKYLKNPADNPLTGDGTKYTFRHLEVAANEAYYNPTKGDFALAYLEHGTAPAGASAVYTQVVQTTAEAMQQFAAQMADPATAPLRVVRADNTAHIVWDKALNATGYSLFQAARDLPEPGALLGTDQHCFVMLRPTGAKLRLSVATSELKLTAPLCLTLRGAWKLPAGASSRAKVVSSGQGQTQIEITPDGYLPLEFELDAG